MSNVIDFQPKSVQPSVPEKADERSHHQYVLQLEHELLEARNALADMALDLFRCRERLDEMPS